MATITQINPDKFSIQDYTFADYDVVPNFEVTSLFIPESGNIEFFVYDANNNLLTEDYKFPGYSFTEDPSITNLGGYSTVNLDPEKDLISRGFDVGQYNVVYNFFENQLGSSSDLTFYIKEISSDRTELRLSSNNLVITPKVFNQFLSKLQDTDYFNEFYLNFGENKIVIAINTQLDGEDILVKLYEPLPSQFALKNTCWVDIKISDPVAYNVSLIQEIQITETIPFLKGPNTNIQIKEEVNNSTELKSYEELIASNYTSSYQQVSNLLNEQGIKISVDYTDFSNFIHFSSAEQRLLNFYEKVSLIENYSNQLSQNNFSITGSTSASYYVSESKATLQNAIDNTIANFDGYEYFLYFESSSYAWPKQNSEPPYILYSTGSTQVLDWIGNSNENAGNSSPSTIYPYGKYGGLALSASLYDNDNQNNLTNTIPDFISNDPQNDPYQLFIEMIGQHFDNVWIYIKDVTNKFDADNRLNYGISKDLVAQSIRDFGLKLYQNQFSTDDLYSAFLGITPSGSLLPSTGSELITSYVTASSDVTPLDDVNKSIYKRLYHNLPYLLNKKGTVQGVKALIASYGIPNTILRVSEFGGKDRDNSNDWDYWYNKFNYAFETSGSKYISSSFSANSDWSSDPTAVEFRFKAENTPPTNYSQSIWSLDGGAELTLEYTGSGLTSGSYSGSVVDEYYQYGTLHFKPTPTTSASVYLPFFDNGWWSIAVNKDSDTYELIAKNKIYIGDDASLIGFQASSSVNVSTTNWSNSTVSTFASGSQEYFSGSLQEIRYYTNPLTQATFNDYVMNPLSIEGNSLNSSPVELIFRAPLGAELEQSEDLQQESVHPKITGSWTVTQSFASDSYFHYSSTPYFAPNTEYIFLDQPAAGIKNRINDKVKIGDQLLPTGNQVLSQYRSVEQQLPLSQSYTPNVNQLEVAFSPQNEVNDDIIEQLGYFNVGNYIGDPRYISSSRTDYEDLSRLANEYFQKYTHNYDVYDYIRLIKYFDNSLFKMIKDFVPAKTSLQSGVVIKQHLLERNRYPQPKISPNTVIAKVQGTGTNSGSMFDFSNQDLTLSGSISVGSFNGGPGGSVNTLNTPVGYLRVQDNDVASNLVLNSTPQPIFTSSAYSWVDTRQNTFFETNGQVVGNGLGLPDTSGRLTNITDYDYTGDIEFSLFNYPGGSGGNIANIKADIVEEGKGIVATQTLLFRTGETLYFRGGDFNQFTFKARKTYYVQLSTASSTTTRVRRFVLTFTNFGHPTNWAGQVYIDDTVDTIAGTFTKYDTSEAQFYNGEYSGSVLTVTTQSLNPMCRVFLGPTDEALTYVPYIWDTTQSDYNSFRTSIAFDTVDNKPPQVDYEFPIKESDWISNVTPGDQQLYIGIFQAQNASDYAGVKYIRIAKNGVGSAGIGGASIDNSQYLQNLTEGSKITLVFDDLGTKELVISSVAEYPTYYQYNVEFNPNINLYGSQESFQTLLNTSASFALKSNRTPYPNWRIANTDRSGASERTFVGWDSDNVTNYYGQRYWFAAINDGNVGLVANYFPEVDIANCYELNSGYQGIRWGTQATYNWASDEGKFLALRYILSGSTTGENGLTEPIYPNNGYMITVSGSYITRNYTTGSPRKMRFFATTPTFINNAFGGQIGDSFESYLDALTTSPPLQFTDSDISYGISKEITESSTPGTQSFETSFIYAGPPHLPSTNKTINDESIIFAVSSSKLNDDGSQIVPTFYNVEFNDFKITVQPISASYGGNVDSPAPANWPQIMATGSEIETIIEPYFSQKFLNTDCDVLAGTTDNDRASGFWMDVDYSSNASVAVNSPSILAGSAVKADVQDSNYTLARHINPRYNGSRTTSEYLNTWTSGSTNTYGKLAVADQEKTYFAYFDFINGLSPELKGKTIAHIQFLVDEEGNAIPPDESKLYITQGTFKTGEQVLVNLNDPLRFEVPMNELNGVQTVVRGGSRVDALLYSDSGSTYTTNINFDTGSFSVTDYQFTARNTNGSSIIPGNDTTVYAYTTGSIGTSGTTFNTETLTNTQYNNTTGVFTFTSDTNSPVKFKAQIDTRFLYTTGAIYFYIVKNWTSGTPTPSQILAQSSYGGSFGSISDHTFNLDTGFQNFDNGDKVQVVYYSTFGNGYIQTMNFKNLDYFQAINQINPSGEITAPYWEYNTGAAFITSFGTWITGSSELSSLYGSKQLDVIPYDGTTNNPEFDPIIQNFTVNVGDEIRFLGAEPYSYMIQDVILPEEANDGLLKLKLDNTLPNAITGSLDHFLLRRYVDDASYVILDSKKPMGSTSPGTMKPEYVTDLLEENFPKATEDIIKSIT